MTDPSQPNSLNAATAAVATATTAVAAPRPNEIVHLRRGGTSVVLDSTALPTPVLVYWGPDLGAVDAAALASLAVAARVQTVTGNLDVTARPGVLVTAASGWMGTPSLEGYRSGADDAEANSFAAQFALQDVEPVGAATELGNDSTGVVLDLVDPETKLDAQVELELGSAGVLRQRITLRNAGATPYTVQSLQTMFPLPWEATEVLDTTGRHLRERSGQRHQMTFGTYQRESRRGRPGADATLLLAAGVPGFGFERGRLYGVHLGWSGNQRMLVERGTTGESFLGAGEWFAPGELVLRPGQSLTTPWAYGSWGDGLNELADRFHREWRARPQHPRRPRPITLNTWEAVYFDHDLAKLSALADAAAQVGVERFVLDDGWFRGRRDDTAGLGDWYVDPDVWPDGLHPLIDKVHSQGMEFGLWVEPEMINPNSDLAREHPDWILQGRSELPPSARFQQVLDLSNPAAYEYISERLHALLDEYPIAYLKWDHNRDLVAPGSGPGGSPRVHANTLALYRLLDELKRDYPELEIESCASGGARVDLGILDRTDRIWTSDCLDPTERLETQRYTGLVVPPEMMGMHLTTPDVHSTGRRVAMDLSGAVALFGHFGIEWDLTTLSDSERALVGEWVALAKHLRPLVASGQFVQGDVTDPGLDVRGMVSDDLRWAAFTISQTQTLIASPTGRIKLPGLDPDARYTIRVVTPGGVRQRPALSPLEWAHHETVMTGRMLAEAGLRPPVQEPGHATVIEVLATGQP